MEKVLNKRQHKRYSARNDEVTVCPEHYGQVEDISVGGMKIKLFDVSLPLQETWKTNFYCDATDTIIHDLPIKLIKDKNIDQFDVDNSYSDISIRVQFVTVNDGHREQIHQHINKMQLAAE